MTESQIFDFIAKKLALKAQQIQTVSKLLDDGATIPFLARYRREVTGNLDEEQLRSIRDNIDYVRTLEQRKSTILESIRDQGKLTDELEKAIVSCTELTVLEDLYLPYRPKRKTRASIAKEKGLEPLAELIFAQETMKGDPEQVASSYIDSEKGVENAQQALQGAMDICAEWVNENVDIREKLRKEFRNFGVITSKKASNISERTVFESYYDFKCRIKYLKPHQTLALNRGERENVLSVNLEVDVEQCLDHIDHILLKNEDHIFTDYFLDATEDSFKRLLYPALEREIRNELTEAADLHAIGTFAENMKNLLMQPPLSHKTIMGIDPAFRTGCKVAIIDATGKYLDGDTIYPTEPHLKIHEAEKILEKLISKYKVDIIAIGNGTASRETEAFVANFLQKWRAVSTDKDIFYLIVNEAGASVYSASTVAREEFPNLDAAQRGNISIARRVLDPLAELVKIDPKSVGVGLYQHDVNQYQLSKKLDDVVESCVNQVGVNLNTASASLLNYVSGLSKSISENIVKRREQQGPFKSRSEILEVSGVGEFKYQQAAGFLRIPDAVNPFDNTAIHPESYDAAKKLCDKFGIDVSRINEMQNKIVDAISNVNKAKLAEEIGVGLPTLELILENLMKPGRDPREELPKPLLRQDILKLEDLSVGDELEGTVRNVVDFGAFVDIGVKQDGLLHISKMGADNQKIENPHEIVSVGDIIKIAIDSIDQERGRISLKLISK